MYYKGIALRESVLHEYMNYRPQPKPRKGKPCDCGLGVGNIDRECMRCGGNVSFPRPNVTKHRLHGKFVLWKGIKCEIDRVDESKPMHTYRLVDCNTLEIYENSFAVDCEVI